MKKFGITAAVTMWLLCFSVLGGTAFAAELVPGGMTVGLELKTGGVVVSRLTEVETSTGKVSPAEEAGLRPGDCIVAIDGEQIRCGSDFTGAIAELDGDEIDVELVRGGEKLSLELQPALGKNGSWQLGLWLRDGASGIGTVTYYDPASGEYGALGHGVNDVDSNTLLPSESGSVSPSVIVDIVRGRAGTPGELWLAFIWALPATGVVCIVFSCVWGNRYHRAVSVSALIWMLALALFLTIPVRNMWLVFVVSVPVQALAVFWFILRKSQNNVC